MADEALEGFDAQREFTEGKKALSAQGAGAQPGEVIRRGIFRAVNDAQVFAAAAFDGWLDKAALAAQDKVERLDDHAFAATSDSFERPLYSLEILP